MSHTADVAIIGGGIIGLTTAYLLAAEGIRVDLVDRSDFGREASWAGAGIIPPGNVANAGDPLANLRAIGSNRFSSFSRDLMTETGIDNGYRTCGILDLTWPAPETVEGWKREGIPHRFADGEEANRVWPQISVGHWGAVFFESGAQVRNPRHLQSLISACNRRKVCLVGHCNLFEYRGNKGRVHFLKGFDGEEIYADHYIIAGGAWSNEIANRFGFGLDIRPVRGQMVLLKREEPAFPCVVEQGRQYMVPRGDGYILIGSTEEPEAGFEKANTEKGVKGLLAFARAVAPEVVESSTVERCWSGLRPGSADGLPTIGPVPGFDNLYVGAGHGRAGIQQSIATGMILRDLVLGRPPVMDIAAFRVGRPPAPPAEPLFRS